MRSNMLLAVLMTMVVSAAGFSQFRARKAPVGETWAQQRTEALAARVGLDDAQKQQVLAAYSAADQQTEPVEERLAAAQAELREATKRNATDAEIDALAASIGALRGELEAIQAKAATAVYNLLTPAQREALSRKAVVGRQPRTRP